MVSLFDFAVREYTKVPRDQKPLGCLLRFQFSITKGQRAEAGHIADCSWREREATEWEIRLPVMLRMLARHSLIYGKLLQVIWMTISRQRALSAVLLTKEGVFALLKRWCRRIIKTYDITETIEGN